jgi:hypothetical protein
MGFPTTEEPLMNKQILAIAAACVVTGCAAAPLKEAPMHYKHPSTVALLPQTSTTLAPDTVLRFDRVDDSRCPPDVVCITAGKIVYHFTLIFPVGVEPFDLEPAAPRYTSVQRPALVIALTNDPPPPRPSNAPPAPPSAVVLSISQPATESP